MNTVQKLESHNIELEKRQEDINQISDDVDLINESFQHLMDHIQNQGKLLDDIESHMDKATIKVELGTEEIKKAGSYADSAKKMMLGLFGFIGTVALGIGIAIGLK